MIWNAVWCEMQSRVECAMRCGMCYNHVVRCGSVMLWCAICGCVWCGCGLTHSTSHYHALVTHFTPCFVTSHHHTAQNSHIILHHSHITCRIMCTMWCCDEMWCDVVWFCDMEWCMMRCGAMWNEIWDVLQCYHTMLCHSAPPHIAQHGRTFPHCTTPHNSTSHCTTFHISSRYTVQTMLCHIAPPHIAHHVM